MRWSIWVFIGPMADDGVCLTFSRRRAKRWYEACKDIRSGRDNGLAFMVLGAAGPATAPSTAPHKATLAVLPFVAADAKDKPLAERMRFAVSQKLSTDMNAKAGGAYERMDNVEVDGVISALQIPWDAADKTPGEEDIQQVIGALGTDFTIAGVLKGRQLGLTLYEGATLAKRAAIEIPPDRESPKLAVERVLTELTGTEFAHIRDVEADHSNAAAEARFAAGPNLVADPGFELAARDAGKRAVNWEALLEADHYPPALYSSDAARNLAENCVVVVPKSTAAVKGAKTDGLCLMMRINKEVAENNGLACESTWIPVEQGKKYRFAASYHSTGPTARVFLKGFAFKPDQFGDKNDPDATRREFYRAQVLPRLPNAGWEPMEMDFTPSTAKATDPKIEWLRVDLFVYLKPGDVFFDDVVVKKLDE